MVNAIARFRALLRNDEGQDLIEYALLAGLIALVAVAGITSAGGEVERIWASISGALGTRSLNRCSVGEGTPGCALQFTHRAGAKAVSGRRSRQLGS